MCNYFFEPEKKNTARCRERYWKDKEFREKRKEAARKWRLKNPDYLKKYYQSRKSDGI